MTLLYLFPDVKAQYLVPILFDSGVVDYCRHKFISGEAEYHYELEYFVEVDVDRYVDSRILCRYLVAE